MESGLRPYPLLNVTDENHKLYQLLNYRTMDVLNVIDLAPLYPEYLVCFSLFGIYIGNSPKLIVIEWVYKQIFSSRWPRPSQAAWNYVAFEPKFYSM